ncbi:WxL protein peptidoglycan domain-containing protein [Leifsonia poae]|uniref:WxL protein peptidoglycan domain-containing protein n=1 Tax=Leifsonia poae TaxID=110933 RepID=UPI001CBEBF74|nr:DUF916 domain-containing protein [Leifsonia poae]
MPVSPLTRIARRRIPLAALAAGLVSLVALGIGVAPASAADTDAISGGPSDDRTRLSYQLQPGQQVADDYVVRNTGTTPQQITLFATDAFTTQDGDYALLDTAKKPTGVGTWVTFEGSHPAEKLTLAPGEQRTVPFTIVVPANAGPGDHPGGIVVSSQKGDGQILVDRRVATRLYVRVPGDLQARLTIASLGADYHSEWNPFTGSTTVAFTVTNSGNVALGAHLLVGANTFFGIGAGATVRKELAELLPGSTRTLSVVVPGVPQTGYLAPYVKLQPTVEKEALNPGPLAAVERDTVVVAVPWWLLILLLLVAAFFLARRLRRRTDGKRAAEWVAFTEAEALRKAREERDAETASSVSTGPGVDRAGR